MGDRVAHGGDRNLAAFRRGDNVRFVEADGALLYVNAKDEEAAAEIEDDFSLLIADIATRLLKQEIDLVVVLPKVLQ